mgnify:CR=1 FL=1
MTMRIKRIAPPNKGFVNDGSRTKQVLGRDEPARISLRERLIAHVHRHPNDLVAFKALFPGIEVQAIFDKKPVR